MKTSDAEAQLSHHVSVLLCPPTAARDRWAKSSHVTKRLTIILLPANFPSVPQIVLRINNQIWAHPSPSMPVPSPLSAHLHVLCWNTSPSHTLTPIASSSIALHNRHLHSLPLLISTSHPERAWMKQNLFLLRLLIVPSVRAVSITLFEGLPAWLGVLFQHQSPTNTWEITDTHGIPPFLLHLMSFHQHQSQPFFL